MTHNTQPLSLISPSLQHAMAAMPRVEGKMKLHTSMIATIIGTVLDRLVSNINMKELVRMALFRRSYSIMNAGMNDMASCRYDVRRIRHSSSLHISIAYSIVYITI